MLRWRHRESEHKAERSLGGLHIVLKHSREQQGHPGSAKVETRVEVVVTFPSLFSVVIWIYLVQDRYRFKFTITT